MIFDNGTLNSKFDKIENTSEERTYEYFEGIVLASTKPTIGLFDKTRIIIIKYGDLPGLDYSDALGFFGNPLETTLKRTYNLNDEQVTKAEGVIKEKT